MDTRRKHAIRLPVSTLIVAATVPRMAYNTLHRLQVQTR